MPMDRYSTGTASVLPSNDLLTRHRSAETMPFHSLCQGGQQVPNRDVHTLVGAATGGVAAWNHQHHWIQPNDRPAFMLGSGLGGAIGGRLPDQLDPPCSPNHRQAAHGILPCTLGTIFFREGLNAAVDWLLEQAESQTDPLARFAIFFFAGVVKGAGPGYLSHILMDGCTPAGLPLLGGDCDEE